MLCVYNHYGCDAVTCPTPKEMLLRLGVNQLCVCARVRVCACSISIMASSVEMCGFSSSSSSSSPRSAWSLSLSLSFSHTHSLFVSLPLSLSQTHTVFVCLSLSYTHTLSLFVSLSLPLSHTHTHTVSLKICYSEFRVPCFLIWWSASRPDPSSRTERGAFTGRRRSPFTSIFGSEFNKIRRGGREREVGERREGGGRREKERRHGGASPPPIETQSAPGSQLNVGHNSTVALLINHPSRHWCSN